ncbi:hypothetical protein F511_18869 [Dorcoceras hygrometricum]|uniref:Uncharacterized protein n=1 Tax=Dorcoceras hygrometricum TaxID=472368 RepID=A0A2Z7AVN5_9LAMI|nr:hypothetical protein F511_18869 [Dorcoceras hygrometricum]
MVMRLATSSHDPLVITDSACKNQSVVVSVQYGPFNTYIPIRSTTIGTSRVARDLITMHTSRRSNSDIKCVTRAFRQLPCWRLAPGSNRNYKKTGSSWYAAVDSSIRSTTGRETPPSACTRRPDEISTDGNSSKIWPEQIPARGGGGSVASTAAAAYSIGYPRMSASGESSTTMHRILHTSGSHPIPTPYDPNWFSKTASHQLTQTSSHTKPAAGYPVARQNNATLLTAGSSRNLKTQRYNYFERRRSTDIIQAPTLAKYQQQAIASKLTRSWTPSRNNETTTHPLRATGKLTRVDIYIC